jgi:hypothetical protein
VLWVLVLRDLDAGIYGVRDVGYCAIIVLETEKRGVNFYFGIYILSISFTISCILRNVSRSRVRDGYRNPSPAWIYLFLIDIGISESWERPLSLEKEIHKGEMKDVW